MMTIPELENENTRLRGVLFCPAVAVWVGLVGCDGGTRFAPEGVVTREGRGAEGIQVTFEPVQGNADQSAVAVTDAEGHFSLASSDGKRKGALFGRKRVLLSSLAGSENTAGDERTRLPMEIVPLRFRDGAEVFDVPAEGSVDVILDITNY
jgi:hypothetical protein